MAIRKETAVELNNLKKITDRAIRRVVRVPLSKAEKALRQNSYAAVVGKVEELREQDNVVRQAIVDPMDLMEHLKTNKLELEAKKVRRKAKAELTEAIQQLYAEAAAEEAELYQHFVAGTVREAVKEVLETEEE